MATEATDGVCSFRSTSPGSDSRHGGSRQSGGGVGPGPLADRVDQDSLIELIKIRGSQINGCAYCLQFHLNAARRAKITETKLGLVAVWRDAGIFSAREKAALAWTEALTHVTPAGVDDPTYNDAAKEFTESELASLTVAIATINAWNRIAMTYRFTPPIPPKEVPQDEAVG
jgi:AhpD family alkylhydroperoxidase